MKVLVTGGSTTVPIDQVRCISNIFKGKTGNDIAYAFWERKADVTLITSNLKTDKFNSAIKVLPYKTYDELYSLMDEEITLGNYDVVIHSAAVSDYRVEGTYIGKPYLSEDKGQRALNNNLIRIDASTKISSDNPELYLKLIPTEKIIDKIRKDWNFQGILVKFKLQVGISNEELQNIALESMYFSDANIIVANCLEWAKERAYLISARNPLDVLDVPRNVLPKMIYKEVHKLVSV